MSYTEADYEALLRKSAPKAMAKMALGSSVISLSEMASLEAGIDQFFPDFDTIETEEQLQEVEAKLGLPREQLAEYGDEIRAQLIKERTYLLYEKVEEKLAGDPAPLQKTAYFGGLNDDEFRLLLFNPTFVDGTYKAVNDARSFEVAYYGSNTARTKGDAFRHTIWNHLLADYNSHEVNYESEAAAWAKKFTDAHESGGTSSTYTYWNLYTKSSNVLEVPMDYHNNARGREHFLSVSRNRGKLNWWGYDSRWVETESVDLTKPKIYAKSQAAVKFTDAGQLSSLTSGLVYIE